MLKHELLPNDSVPIVKPEAPLKSKDFEELNREVDPSIEEADIRYFAWGEKAQFRSA